jgi:hypothetical protein
MSSCRGVVYAANYRMAGADNDKLDSLRPNRLEGGRIVFALAVSLLAHVLIFGGYELSRTVPVLRHLLWVAQQRQLAQTQPTEQPLEFVTVRNPSPQAPPKAIYYSNHNSVAANPDATRNTDQPKLTGKQTDVPDTQDETRYQRSKSPTGADQHQSDSALENLLNKPPQPSQTPGDLTLGKPDQTPPQPPRPRTVKEALAAMANRTPSMMMNQDGGVRHHDVVSSLDVQLTGFGDYDAQFIDTVRDNWLTELGSHQFSEDRIGKVELDFQLSSDGRVSEMRVAQSTVGDLLAYVCEKAVLEGAPYAPWTEDMRRTIGESRAMKFTFYYEQP